MTNLQHPKLQAAATAHYGTVKQQVHAANLKPSRKENPSWYTRHHAQVHQSYVLMCSHCCGKLQTTTAEGRQKTNTPPPFQHIKASRQGQTHDTTRLCRFTYLLMIHSTLSKTGQSLAVTMSAQQCLVWEQLQLVVQHSSIKRHVPADCR